MSKKEIIINATKEQARIAILEQGDLVELHVENQSYTRTIGDIHYAYVRNLMPSIQAAFVDIGMKQDAFLHFSDVSETLPPLLNLLGEEVSPSDFTVSLRTNRRRSSPVDPEDATEEEEDEKTSTSKNDNSTKRSETSDSNTDKKSDAKSDPVHPARYLRNNQRILVQITKEPMSSKGSRVTTNITLAGRFLVLVPYGDYVAVSRRIWSVRERRRLRTLAKSLVPDGFGLIIRTVAESRDAKTLDRDLRLLLDKWEKIKAKLAEKPKPPQLLLQDVSMVSSVVRDLFTDDYERILVDDSKLHRSIKTYIQAVAPDMVPAIQLHRSKKPIFRTVGIADAITEAFSSRVNLPSGGYIFIEHTEAMHVIDVNSGRAGKGKTQEDNSLKVNIEAARVIAKHLRLRDLGGIIVIDFIDLREDKNRKKVYDELKRAFRRDRAVTKVLPMSDFGLMQITRQRLRPSITRDPDATEEALQKSNGQTTEKEKEEVVLDSEETSPKPKRRNRSRKDRPRPNRPRRVTIEELETLLPQWLAAYRQKTNSKNVILCVHPFTATYLNHGIFSLVRRWSLKHSIKIQIETDEKLGPTRYAFKDPETQEDITEPFNSTD